MSNIIKIELSLSENRLYVYKKNENNQIFKAVYIIHPVGWTQVGLLPLDESLMLPGFEKEQGILRVMGKDISIEELGTVMLLLVKLLLLIPL